MPVTTVEWLDNKVKLIDQTRLPGELVHLHIDQVEVLGEAIKKLRVRGAPAIGIAGAFGVLLGVQHFHGEDKGEFFSELDRVVAYLRGTRPTAVNLFWALERMRRTAETIPEVTVFERPKGFPTAMTVSPIRRSDEEPGFAAFRSFALTVRRARSLSASAPFTSASSSRPSAVVTTMRDAPWTTWSFVMTTPEGERTTPEPSDSVR